MQLCKHKIDTQVDVEVKLDKPIEIKAGEALGLMGEYNQIGESGEKPVSYTHLRNTSASRV